MFQGPKEMLQIDQVTCSQNCLNNKQRHCDISCWNTIKAYLSGPNLGRWRYKAFDTNHLTLHAWNNEHFQLKLLVKSRKDCCIQQCSAECCLWRCLLIDLTLETRTFRVKLRHPRYHQNVLNTKHDVTFVWFNSWHCWKSMYFVFLTTSCAWVEHSRYEPGDANTQNETFSRGFQPSFRHLIKIVVDLRETSHKSPSRQTKDVLSPKFGVVFIIFDNFHPMKTMRILTLHIYTKMDSTVKP